MKIHMRLVQVLYKICINKSRRRRSIVGVMFIIGIIKPRHPNSKSTE